MDDFFFVYLLTAKSEFTISRWVIHYTLYISIYKYICSNALKIAFFHWNAVTTSDHARVSDPTDPLLCVQGLEALEASLSVWLPQVLWVNPKLFFYTLGETWRNSKHGFKCFETLVWTQAWGNFTPATLALNRLTHDWFGLGTFPRKSPFPVELFPTKTKYYAIGYVSSCGEQFPTNIKVCGWAGGPTDLWGI